MSGLRDSKEGNNRNFAIDSVTVEFEGSGDGADGLADPTGIDTWAYGFDDPGGLVAIFGWRYGCFEILSVAEHDLRAVQSKSFHAEQDLTWPGLRQWEFVKLKDFGGSGLVEANDLYGIRHA
jgi:hypothetical protein